MASPRQGAAGPVGTATGSPCRGVRLGLSKEFGSLLLSLKRLVPDLRVHLQGLVADALLQSVAGRRWGSSKTSSLAGAASGSGGGCIKTPFGPLGRNFRCKTILCPRPPRMHLQRIHGGAPERAVELSDEVSRTCQPAQASTYDRTRRIRAASAASTDLFKVGGRWH